MTAPFVSLRNLGGCIICDSDPGLVMWTISWVNHALMTQPLDLFAANAFYPSAGSLSFSEHAFGLAVLVFPWSWFSANPVVPYNLLFLLTYFASAAGMYALCWYYTRSRAASFIGGLIFGFCFFRAHHFGHLTLIANQWFPFLILIFHKLRERFAWWPAALWVALFVLQCLTNWYNAAFITLILTWIMAADFIRQRWNLRAFGRFALCGVLAAVLILPFYIPYSRHPAPDDYSENEIFSADLMTYFDPPFNTMLGRYLENSDRWIWGEKSIFIGFLPFLMAIAGILAGRGRCLIWTYCSLGAIALVLSLGPTGLNLGGWMPIAHLYDLLPPIGKLRATARFSVIVVFCVAVLAALFLSRIRHAKWWLPPVTLIVLLEFYPVGFDWNPATVAAFEPRPVDIWLREQNTPESGKVVLELPDYSGTDLWFRESAYMLYSTQHWMKLVNGYTRYYPADYLERFRLYSRFPAEEAIEAMKSIGVDYVVVHSEEYDFSGHPLLVAALGSDWIFELATD